MSENIRARENARAIAEKSEWFATCCSDASWQGIRGGLCSCNELAGTTSSLDTLLSNLWELLGLDEAWHIWELSLSENLEESLIQTKKAMLVYYLIITSNTYSLGNIDHSSLCSSRVLTCLFWDEGPELVKVHSWSVVLIFLIVEVTLSFLSEVAWMTAHNKKKCVNILAPQTRQVWHFKKIKKLLTISPSWSYGGGDLQHYHDHLGAFWLYRLFRVP